MKIPLFLTVVVVLTASQRCPPPERLHPCTCRQGDTLIYFECIRLQEKFNLKELFDNVTEVVDTDYGFQLLAIRYTSLTEIGDETVEQLKFLDIRITNNANLTYISPRAFGATRNYTRHLDLRWNNIRNDPPHEMDIYDLYNGFENATIMSITSNNLSSIPNNAFQKHGSITSLNLNWNRISHIGSRAFASIKASDILNIYLNNNLLPSAGLPEDAFEGIPSNWVGIITLYCNEPMKYLEQKSYQTVLELAASIILSTAASCPDGQDPYYECDVRSDWICDGEDKYRPKLFGFRCRPETGLTDIWDYCDRKNSTVPPTTTLPTTTSDPDIFSCLGRPDSVYAFPGDCGKFIICREDLGEAFECPEPLKFHPVNRHCTYPEWVDCGGSCGA